MRDDCDKDLMKAQKLKDQVKQQLDLITDEVQNLNDLYEQTKMDSRDLAVAIEAARIEIKKTDKSIFETQQEIKIKQVEQMAGRGDGGHSDDSTGIVAQDLDQTIESVVAPV